MWLGVLIFHTVVPTQIFAPLTHKSTTPYTNKTERNWADFFFISQPEFFLCNKSWSPCLIFFKNHPKNSTYFQHWIMTLKIMILQFLRSLFIKFGLSKKHTKFEKKIHLDLTLLSNIKSKWKIFFQILWTSQNIWTLLKVSRYVVWRK